MSKLALASTFPKILSNNLIDRVYHSRFSTEINPLPYTDAFWLVPLQQTAFWKHSDKRRNCTARAISPFATMFSTLSHRLSIQFHCLTKYIQSRLMQNYPMRERVNYNQCVYTTWLLTSYLHRQTAIIALLRSKNNGNFFYSITLFNEALRSLRRIQCPISCLLHEFDWWSSFFKHFDEPVLNI